MNHFHKAVLHSLIAVYSFLLDFLFNQNSSKFVAFIILAKAKTVNIFLHNET